MLRRTAAVIVAATAANLGAAGGLRRPAAAGAVHGLGHP